MSRKDSVFMSVLLCVENICVIVHILSCSVCSGLVGALHAQLSDMEQTVLKYRKDTSLPVPQPFHFQLPASDRLLTVTYPAGVTDDQLLPVREVSCFFLYGVGHFSFCLLVQFIYKILV